MRAGGRATLILRVQPWRASPRVLRIPVRLPARPVPGASGVTVVPKSPGGFDSRRADLSQDLGAGGRHRRAQRGGGAGRARSPGAPPARASSASSRASRRANDDRNDAVRLLGPDDDADDPAAGVTVPVPYVIYGGRATVRITVR